MNKELRTATWAELGIRKNGGYRDFRVSHHSVCLNLCAIPSNRMRRDLQ
jgi:hypothetical protein